MDDEQGVRADRAGQPRADVDAPVPVGPLPSGWGSYEHLRAVFEQAPVAMSILDLRTRELWTNAAYLHLFGFDGPDAPAPDSTDLTHPEGREETGRLLQLLVVGHIDRIDLDKRYLRPDGSSFWGHLDATLLRDDGGRPWAVLSVCRDITASREAERAIRSSEERFRALVQHSDDAILVLDAAGVLTYASPAAARLAGRPVHGQLGRDALELVHPDDRDVVAHSFADTAGRPGLAVPLRFRVVRDDGSHRYVEAVANNLLDDPVVAGVVVNLRDLTDRARAEDALELSENRFRKMLENISDTVTLLDADGRVLATTGNLRGILGYQPGHWDGRSAWELVHPEDLPLAEQIFQRIMDHPGENCMGEVRLRRSDGGHLQVEVAGVNLLEDPSVRAVVLTSRDASDRRQAEAELAAARDIAVRELEHRTEFIASVTHELRTPIHGIAGLSELLSAAAELPGESRELVRSIGKATRSLQVLLDDLLDYARIESGQLVLSRAPVDLGSVVEEVRVSFAAELAAGHVSLRTELAPTAPQVVSADARRLRQILSNLVANAVKFTPEGEIVLRVERDDVHAAPPAGDGSAATGDVPLVRFVVRDPGIGIDPDALGEVFEPFSSAHATTAGDYGGAGLGLTITRQLVELMGGAIEVASQPGAGSTFTVSLPLPEHAPAPGRGRDADVAPDATPDAAREPSRSGAQVGAATTGAATTGAARTGAARTGGATTGAATTGGAPVGGGWVDGGARTVLVVEDNAVNRLLTEHQLSRLGYTPVVAESGEAALTVLADMEPAAVLMDCQMDGIDGFETTRRLREWEASTGRGRRPVIAVTANALPGERVRAVEAGMDDLVAKPVGLQVLGRVLGGWLEHEARSADAGVGGGTAYSAPATFDESVLAALHDELGDRAVVARVVGAYLRELPVRVEDLERAVAEGDLDTVGRVAHTLASTSATVGAERLASWGRRLERAAVERPSAHRTTVAAMVGAISAERGEVERFLAPWAASDGDGGSSSPSR